MYCAAILVLDDDGTSTIRQSRRAIKSCTNNSGAEQISNSYHKKSQKSRSSAGLVARKNLNDGLVIC